MSAGETIGATPHYSTESLFLALPARGSGRDETGMPYDESTNISQISGEEPNNITAFGIDRGSASVYYHISTGDLMFDCEIMIEMAAPSLRPLRLDSFEKGLEDLCKSHDVEDKIQVDPLELSYNGDRWSCVREISKARWALWLLGGHGSLMENI